MKIKAYSCLSPAKIFENKIYFILGNSQTQDDNCNSHPLSLVVLVSLPPPLQHSSGLGTSLSQAGHCQVSMFAQCPQLETLRIIPGLNVQ